MTRFESCIEFLARKVIPCGRASSSSVRVDDRSTELQKRGAPHFHAVCGNIPQGYSEAKAKELWEELAGFCRISKYKASKGAEYYMAKSSYAWKHGEIDLSPGFPCTPCL